METLNNLDEVDITQLLYARQTPKNVESFTSCKLLTGSLESRGSFDDFLEQKLYLEYFDNRLYLVEQYLDFVQRVLESENTYSNLKDSSTNFNLYAYIRLSLERFS